MLNLCARIRRPLFASSQCCFRINCNLNTSSYPPQVLHPVDNDFNDFLPWLRHKYGAEITTNLSIGKSSHGRSLFACKTIQAGDCILNFPQSMELTQDNLPPKVSSLLRKDVDNRAKLALVILLHQKLGQTSEWAPYISSFPPVEEMHNMIFWSDEELEMIKTSSSLYKETLKRKDQVEKDFSSIKHVLDHFPEYFEHVTFHKFKHAHGLVGSRAWVDKSGPALTSEWAPYISSFPRVEEMHNMIFWSDEELEMIKISSYLHKETLKRKDQVEKHFSSIKHVLDHFPEYFEHVTFHKFKHAHALVGSRAWFNRWSASLVPFLEFCNHDAFSETTVQYDDSAVQYIAGKNYAPGDEVFIKYGDISNAELLLSFGFVIPFNKFDDVQVDINLPQHDHMREMKLDFLDKQKILSLKDANKLHSPGIRYMVKEVKSSSGKGRGIPQGLRTFARVVCCTSLKELQDLAMEATQNDGRLTRIPLKNKAREMEAHQFLNLRFSDMIENYNAALESLSCHTSPPLSGNHPRRMQLARDFLAEELKILKSGSAWLKKYCETLKD